MPQPRLRRVASVHALDSAVEDYRFRGYRVLERYDDEVLMQQVNKGTVQVHVVLGLLTAWCTLGLVNVAYAWLCQVNADRVRIVVTATPN